MYVFLAIIVFLFILIWPVRFAARAVGAGRDSIGMCFVAVLIVGMVNSGISSMDLGGDTLTLVGITIGSFLFTGMIFSILLQTSFKGGIVITVIQYVLSFLLAIALVFVLGIIAPEVSVPF